MGRLRDFSHAACAIATATAIVQWSGANFDQRDEGHASKIDMNAEACMRLRRRDPSGPTSARAGPRRPARAAVAAALAGGAPRRRRRWSPGRWPTMRRHGDRLRQDAAIGRQVRRDLDERIAELAACSATPPSGSCADRRPRYWCQQASTRRINRGVPNLSSPFPSIAMKLDGPSLFTRLRSQARPGFKHFVSMNG